MPPSRRTCASGAWTRVSRDYRAAEVAGLHPMTLRGTPAAAAACMHACIGAQTLHTDHSCTAGRKHVSGTASRPVCLPCGQPYVSCAHADAPAGKAHCVGGSDYGHVRVGAFMGLRICSALAAQQAACNASSSGISDGAANGGSSGGGGEAAPTIGALRASLYSRLPGSTTVHTALCTATPLLQARWPATRLPAHVWPIRPGRHPFLAWQAAVT